MNLKRFLFGLTTVCAFSATLPANANDNCKPCSEPCDFSLCCDPCDGWRLSFDWLYWKARQCDIDYGVPFSDSFSAATSVIEGSEFAPSTKYDSGFRVGVNKSCGDLEFGVQYSFYRTNASDRRENENGDFFANTRLGYAFKLLGDRAILLATAKYELDYDVVDVNLGYNMSESNCFHSLGLLGFRYAKIDRELKASYSSSIDLTSSALTQDNIALTNDMNAYGIFFGNGSRLKVSNCLNLTGGFDFGLLAADVKRTFKYNGIAAGSPVDAPSINYKDDCWKVVSNFNLAVGVEFEFNNCFCADWTLGVGYEFHQWHCLPEFINLIVNQAATATTHDQFFDHGDGCLSFDGLYVRLSVLF